MYRYFCVLIDGKGMNNGRGNHIKRAARIQQIVSEYYEPENLRKCKRAVFRYHVKPIYQISERTFWRYMAVDVESEHQTEKENRQLRLF